MANLMPREYMATVSLVTVRDYLLAWSLRPREPVRRAYKRNDAAISRRTTRSYSTMRDLNVCMQSRQVC